MPSSPDRSQEADSPAQTRPSRLGLSGLGQSAIYLSIGNVAGRVLGLAREVLIASLFGGSGQVSAFTIASQVPTMLYDLLAGGMLSASLVPTLSEYATKERRREFVQLASMLLTIFAFVLAVLVLLLEIFAPQIAYLMAWGQSPELLQLTIHLLRIVLPAVWFISMAGIVTGILYAQQRFVFPAAAAAIFNMGIVVAVWLLTPNVGITSLSLGVLLGSILQFLLMSWDLKRFLREGRQRLRWVPNWRHPALRKIIWLYLPILVVTLFANLQTVVDRGLATTTDDRSIAWMRYATTLQQLPLGLIPIAVSLASLPRLSQFFADGDLEGYRQTLGSGLRIVFLLIAPAAVVLWLLDGSIVRLIFEHLEFKPSDTIQVRSALQIYTVGMVFAAVDFLLNYAFYARNNTVLPAAAGIFSILVYIGAALLLIEPLGYHGLVWADTIKHGSHLLFIGIALWFTVGRLQNDVVRCFGYICLGALGMAAAIWVVRWLASGEAHVSSLSPTFIQDLASLIGLGGTGLVVYISILYLFRIDEVRWLVSAAKNMIK